MSEAEEITKRYARRLNQPLGRYSLFDEANLHMVQERERACIYALSKAGVRSLSDLRVLEVGCGTGAVLLDLLRWGVEPANLYGVELIAERARAAARRIRGVQIRTSTAEQLDFVDGFFDIVVQATMFSSIHDKAVRMSIAKEMVRVLSPRGLIVWYDLRYPNPANPDVRPIGRRELVSLFPGFRSRLLRVTLMPPLVRILIPRLRVVAQALTLVPALRSHYVAVLSRAR